MAQIINTNLPSLNAQRNLSTSGGQLAQSIQRLSSGLRVNSAKDDAAGLAIAERMNSQVRGMNVAMRNANDAISMSQTAEGALGKVGDMLQRMRELAVQSSNATNSQSDRDALQSEFAALQAEIDRTAETTRFNGQAVLTQTTAFDFQVGSNATTDDQVSVSAVNIIGATTTTGTNDGALATTVGTSIDISSVGTRGSAATSGDYGTYSAGTAGTGALGAIELIDYALQQVNTARSSFGAAQNRFESVIANLQVAVENQSAARSRIMDADFAMETAHLARSQVLQQAGNAMLAQANQLPQNVLALLRN
ncbi:MAG: flagellin FliC [Burkholderiaceae bacterium]|nr:flagellin FliC [Burkholderiaceae bacterium]MBP7660568.1 flagellin FliC [Burkholderiaceae bacterium]